MLTEEQRFAKYFDVLFTVLESRKQILMKDVKVVDLLLFGVDLMRLWSPERDASKIKRFVPIGLATLLVELFLNEYFCLAFPVSLRSCPIEQRNSCKENRQIFYVSVSFRFLYTNFTTSTESWIQMSLTLTIVVIEFIINFAVYL